MAESARVKLLFIGASGYVGSHALSLARSRGHEALGTQSSAGHPDLLAFDLRAHRLPDVLPAAWRSGAGGFGVICASVRQIDRCLLEREQSRQVNVTGTIQAIQDLAAMGYQPVFLSTSYVFSGREGYYTKTDQPDAICAYGRDKAEVEAWIQTHQPEMPVLRLDKIVGDDPGEEHLFTEWLRWIRDAKPVTCIADQILSPTFVRDIGAAILLACERNLRGVYHAANPEFFSREELARQFARLLGRPLDIQVRGQETFRFADPRPLKTYLDSSRFIAETGFRFTAMREVMTRFIRRAFP